MKKFIYLSFCFLAILGVIWYFTNIQFALAITALLYLAVLAASIIIVVSIHLFDKSE